MDNFPEYRAGNLDWLAIWQDMYDRERAQGEAATDPNFERSADQWASRATHFARISHRASQPDRFMQCMLPRLRPTDTVLDIGAGAGRYVSILARSVAHVIALEPSPAMCKELERHISDEQIDNVTIVADRWPTNAIPPVDVALSAHVIYAVRDIGPFLQAMNAVAQRLCFLFLGIEHPGAIIDAFWQRFHGEPRRRLPAALEAFNVLHQLGFYATMESVSMGGPPRYANSEEALNDIRRRLRLTPDAARDNAIIAAMNESTIVNPDGSVSISGPDRHGGVISWETTTAQNAQTQE